MNFDWEKLGTYVLALVVVISIFYFLYTAAFGAHPVENKDFVIAGIGLLGPILTLVIQFFYRKTPTKSVTTANGTTTITEDTDSGIYAASRRGGLVIPPRGG